MLPVFLLIYIICFSQNKNIQENIDIENLPDFDYNQILDSLCSPEFHGRGYEFKGTEIASEYIAQKLESFKLEKYRKSYFQEFEININILEGENFVGFDNIELKPAEDYLISSFSKPAKGKFKVMILDSSIINDTDKFSEFRVKDFKNSFLLIDTTGVKYKDFDYTYQMITQKNKFKAKGIIESSKSLMYMQSGYQADFTHFTLLKNSYLQPPDSISVNIETRFIKSYPTRNIAAYIQGETDTCFVFSAHYDHLGHMGKSVYFPGANDNASGVTMLLALARYYSFLQSKPHYTIVFLFFSAEETGLNGSKYFTENPLFPLEKIKFLLNLDMVGSGDKGIQVVNGSVLKREFDILTEQNNLYHLLPHVKTRGEAANSDHYFFYEKGVRAFFIYTLGEYKEYHNIKDNPKNLPLNEFNDLFKLLIYFQKNI